MALLRRPSALIVFGTLALASSFLVLEGCASDKDWRRDPTGELFASVRAESLAGDPVSLPADLSGQPTVLLVGYVQDAQFDCDRWLLGLLQAKTPVRFYEVPTIEGMVPRMISGTIDEGMRSGIPEEDWGLVLTVYADASEIADQTGKAKPNNARVFLLDEAGRIVWFHDRGYSASKLLELDGLCRGDDEQ